MMILHIDKTIWLYKFHRTQFVHRFYDYITAFKLGKTLIKHCMIIRLFSVVQNQIQKMRNKFKILFVYQIPSSSLISFMAFSKFLFRKSALALIAGIGTIRVYKTSFNASFASSWFKNSYSSQI